MTADSAPTTARPADELLRLVGPAVRSMYRADDAERINRELRALLSPPSAAQEQLTRIADSIGLTREDGAWWLPAEPGPVECVSIAEAVERYIRLCDKEDMAAAQEIERLRAALEGFLALEAMDPDDRSDHDIDSTFEAARRALTQEDRNGR